MLKMDTVSYYIGLQICCQLVVSSLSLLILTCNMFFLIMSTVFFCSI